LEVSSLRCRPVALSLVALYLAGCHTWQPTTVSPRLVVEEEHPAVVRVTRTDGLQLTIQEPQAEGDSIVGRRGRAVAFSNIEEMDVQRFDGAGTAWALATVALIAGVVYPVTQVESRSERRSMAWSPSWSRRGNGRGMFPSNTIEKDRVKGPQ
jgi:hypothetical protein